MRWERGLPRLVVHEKYEQAIKWVLRTLTLVGILSALVSLTPIGGLALGLLLLLVEQFVERAVIEYTTIYVLPMPDFEYVSEAWAEMVFALPEGAEGLSDPTLPSLCCLGITTPEQAAGTMRLLRLWATGPEGDGVSNLILSFVLEDFGGYTAYVYPDLEVRGLKELFEETRRLQLEEKLSKQQQEFVMFFKLGKYFATHEKSMFGRFVKRQQEVGSPCVLGCYLKQDGAYMAIDRDHWIPVVDLRIKNRADLEESEVEWEDPKAVRRLAVTLERAH